MKNKIYSKLFNLTEGKDWYKWSSNGNTQYKSDFYDEYTLIFEKKEITWNYIVERKGTFTKNINKGLVTLNIGGKIIFTISMFIILFILFLILHIRDYKVYLAMLPISFFLSYFAFSIFNWKIYRTFRKVQYYVRNKKKIDIKAELEVTEKQIVAAINKKIQKDPKLARRTKLKQIEKSQ